MNRADESASNGLLDTKSSLKPALFSSLLAWLAFPPADWSWLVWIAPIGWLSLIMRETLPGRRPYVALWFAGFTFWLLTVHWIRLPHPANYLALIVLASYLGCYLPIFVATSRVGVHQLRWPLWMVAPIVWTGLDWFRHYLMTGFGFGSLAHTQANFLEVIQIADVLGEYGVSFLIVFVSTCITMALAYDSTRHERSRVRHTVLYVLLGGVALGGTLAYGALFLHLKLEGYNRATRTHRIALIQGNTLADWKGDEEKQRSIMDEYMRLSLEAVQRSQSEDQREVDLVIWPETTFRQTLATVAEGYQPPADRVHDSYLTAGQRDLGEFVNQTGTAILTGIDRVHIYPTDHGHPDFKAYNSSVLVDEQGQVVGTYDKMHRVPFGEFIPLADWFPALYRFTPLTGGVSAGEQPELLELGQLKIAPNICYETCVPHLIRRHVNRADKTIPNVLVNLTNDAWYWGSSELDMHLACGVFRAVEHHLQLVIAANGGLSAHIGPSGKIHQVTQRQQTQTLLVELREPTGRGLTFYAIYGDWFAGICVVCCVVLAIVGWRGRVASPSGDALRRD